MKFECRFYDGQFLPIVLMGLNGKHGWFQCRVYIDTGASYSLFHADVAEMLGISLEEGQPHEVTVGDGNTLKVFLHKVKVSLAGQEFEATIGFSNGLGIGFHILGRKTIFDKFVISFNEKEKYIEFTPLLK
ncbi:retroviral-like aspartic protease [Candidatus Woesearchaeota archaeon]|nr:retroviral-like aspartic protease [Candidatus Woesearchaeota archaeon]